MNGYDEIYGRWYEYWQRILPGASKEEIERRAEQSAIAGYGRGRPPGKASPAATVPPPEAKRKEWEERGPGGVEYAPPLRTGEEWAGTTKAAIMGLMYSPSIDVGTSPAALTRQPGRLKRLGSELLNVPAIRALREGPLKGQAIGGVTAPLSKYLPSRVRKALLYSLDDILEMKLNRDLRDLKWEDLYSEEELEELRRRGLKIEGTKDTLRNLIRRWWYAFLHRGYGGGGAR